MSYIILGFMIQLSSKDPNSRCYLDKAASERALLLKGPDSADWGILIGGWTGFKQGQKGIPGVPGDRNSKRKGQKGVKGSPGNPGFLYCRFYNLKAYEGTESIHCTHALRNEFKFTIPGQFTLLFQLFKACHLFCTFFKNSALFAWSSYYRFLRKNCRWMK